MKLFKKKINIESTAEFNADSVKLWSVSWDRRYGKYCNDTTRCKEFFFSLEDAEEFKKRLEDATKILRHTESINIHLEKEK